MIAEFSDRGEVGRYVSALREQLGSGAVDGKTSAAAAGIGRAAPDPVSARQAVLDALADDDTGDPSSGEADEGSLFFSRSPAISLMQTSLEDEARKSGVVGTPSGERGPFGRIVGVIESIERTIEEHLDPTKFSTDDPDWVTRIAEATLDRLARGNHPFNPTPAEYEIADGPWRLLVVGDWGSGLPRAQRVASLMGEEIADAISRGLPVHALHLGDVYYSGDPVEIQRRVLAEGMWPVTADQAARGVTSWSLNGNHDMYAGGWGYFDTLLADERFKHQRSPDGRPTSFFRIKTPSWDLVGLDTSWDTDVLSKGLSGVLADPQATVVEGWAAECRREGRRLMLLSHHQFVTSYDVDDIGTVLPQKLAPVLEARQIAAWLWGHEHRCMGFEETQGIPYARLIGHGGIPILAHGGVPVFEPTERVPIPPPGIWQETGIFEENGQSWHRFGFAALDFDGAEVQVRYRDDEGTQTRVEVIP